MYKFLSEMEDKLPVEPGGYCRLAAIPDGVVGKQADDSSDDDSDAE